jgi:hypothetical protein
MSGRFGSRFGVVAVFAALALMSGGSAGAATSDAVSPAVDVSPCAGQNAEVEQAVDSKLGYVYEVFMGCKGISFARSTNGGLSFDAPISVPDSVGSNYNAWDPAVAVAPDGTVYAAFMLGHSSQWYPVVDASFDHGQTFTQVSELVPPDEQNWGDRDFIAVDPDGSVYVTWDYGPSRKTVTFICDASGSCGYSTGQLNVVMQKSTDGGKTFTQIGAQGSYVSPGFPASGGDSAPMVIEPSGRIDVLYQGYPILDTSTYALGLGHEYFTSSSDGGKSWSAPVEVGAGSGTMSLAEWWIDGDISMDSAGNLYAVWDTQGSTADVGWLSYSTDHGAHWSTPIQVPPDQANVPHVMEVAGGGSGIAYVSFFSSADPQGYADYLRTFSITRGWLSAAVRVSPEFGETSVWPGDTFGISTLAPGHVVLSWGSATPSSKKKSEIWAAQVTVAAH